MPAGKGQVYKVTNRTFFPCEAKRSPLPIDRDLTLFEACREREAVLVLRPAVVRGSWGLLEVKPPPTPPVAPQYCGAGREEQPPQGEEFNPRTLLTYPPR